MSLIMTLIAALAGAAVFERFGVPAGALLGSMIGVGAVNILAANGALVLPPTARFLSYAGIGWLIGQGVARDIFSTLLRSAVPIVSVVIGLLAFGAALGWCLVYLGVLDSATAYLATSPGALSQMAAVGASVGADASLVVAIHTLRVVALAIAAPFIGRLAGVT